MPWAGVALTAHAGQRSIPYLQGVFALLVVASLTRLKTVVTRGWLPKSSHCGRRSGGLPMPPLPLLVVARARVWVGGLAGPDTQSCTHRERAERVIHSTELTCASQACFEQMFYSSHHGKQSPVPPGGSARRQDAALLGAAYPVRAWTVARTDSGVAAGELWRLAGPGRVRARSQDCPFGRSLVPGRPPAAGRELANRGCSERGTLRWRALASGRTGVAYPAVRIVDTSGWIGLASIVVATLIAVVIPWFTFRLALRQDHTRWLLERRAELYVDLLTEAYAEQQWLEFRNADPEIREEMARHFDDLRLPPLDRARLGVRATMYGSLSVNGLFNRLPAEAFWSKSMFNPKTGEGDRLILRMRIGEIMDELTKVIRAEMATDRHLTEVQSHVLTKPYPAQRETARWLARQQQEYGPEKEPGREQ
jgi:hypothetical protein